MPHFWFIRHGQATHNVDALIRGEHAYFDPVNTDAELTDVGLQQARDARGAIPDDLVAVYCSPSRRCRQTLLGAAPAQAEKFGVMLDDRLMEPQGDALCNKRIERAALAGAVPVGWTLNGVAEENPYVTWKGEGYSCGSDGYQKFAARVRDFTQETLVNRPVPNLITGPVSEESCKLSRHCDVNEGVPNNIGTPRYHGPEDRILIVSHHDWIRTWFNEHLGQNVSPANCQVLEAVWPPQKVECGKGGPAEA